MTNHDHLRYALRLVPVVSLIVAYTKVPHAYVAAMAVLAAIIWIWDIWSNTTLDDQISTWWVGDGHGNGVTIVAYTAEEAIAKAAQETFDLRAELIGVGEIH